MNAWFLAVLLCAPASSTVVEVRVAAPATPAAGSLGAAGAVTGVRAVPSAVEFAPLLRGGAAVFLPPGAPKSFGTVPFAPTLKSAIAPGQVQPSGVPQSAPSETVSPAPLAGREKLPPPSTAVEALAARLRASQGSDSSADFSPAASARGEVEGAAAEGGRLFDLSAERGALDDGDDGAPPAVAAPSAPGARLSPGLTLGARTAADSSVAPEASAAMTPGIVLEGEALRDAIASPPSSSLLARPIVTPVGYGVAASFVRASAATARPFPALSASDPARTALGGDFERLELRLGSDLSVQVAPTRPPSSGVLAPRPFAAGTLSSRPEAAATLRSRSAPLTSTEWLERRGLLETLSASEAVAAQQLAFAAPRSATPVGTAPSRRVPRGTPYGSIPALALWGLAFLPAAAVLARELR